MKDFIYKSVQLGKNPSYAQGAGGNSSIKVGNRLFIKASGYRMKEMKKDYGIACCDYKKIIKYLETKEKFKSKDADEYMNAVSSSVVKSATYGLPSMETGMHAALPSKYVFHLHSVYANIFNCMKYGKLHLKKILPKNKYIVVDFVNPGYELAYLLKKHKRKIPSIIFLKNHGIVVHGNSLNSCMNLIDIINKKIIGYLTEKNVYKEFTIDKNLQKMNNHLFPDSVVFSTVNITKLNEQKKESYQEIMSACKYLTGMIKKLNAKPTYIDKKNVDLILNMKQEKHRLKIFNT